MTFTLIMFYCASLPLYHTYLSSLLHITMFVFFNKMATCTCTGEEERNGKWDKNKNKKIKKRNARWKVKIKMRVKVGGIL